MNWKRITFISFVLVKVQNKISIIKSKVYKLFLTFNYMNKYVHIYSSKSKVQLIKK